MLKKNAKQMLRWLDQTIGKEYDASGNFIVPTGSGYYCLLVLSEQQEKEHNIPERSMTAQYRHMIMALEMARRELTDEPPPQGKQVVSFNT